MTKPNNYAHYPRCGVGLAWRTRRVTDPRCPICPPDAAPPDRVPFGAVRSKLRLSLDDPFLGVGPTADTARIAASFIRARTTPDGFRRWFLDRLGDAPSIRVTAGSWGGDYLGSILPGLPIWIKDIGGYPAARRSSGKGLVTGRGGVSPLWRLLHDLGGIEGGGAPCPISRSRPATPSDGALPTDHAMLGLVASVLSNSYLTGSTTTVGTRTVNVEPWPWTLSTVRSTFTVRLPARVETPVA